MKDALRVFWQALRDTYTEIVFLVAINLVTVLLLVPIVTAPPALAGLWAVGNRVAHGRSARWGDYFAAFREHFGRAWAIAGLHIVILAVIASNYWFYTPGNNPFDLSPQVATFIQAVWVGALIFWLLLSQYFLPLILEQEDLRLRITLRNAVVLLITRPGFSAVLLILIALTVAVSTALTLPWLLVTPAFLAVLTNGAVLRLLEGHRE